MVPECATCHPIVDGDRRHGEHHFGVRFGDHPFVVILDERVELQNCCDEAWAGADGWIRMFVFGEHGWPEVCSGTHARTWIRRGNVQVRRWGHGS